MSSGDDDDIEAKLLQKHKKEKKELQAIIQSLKNSQPKGKKKKQTLEQISQLESELNARHQLELSELNVSSDLTKANDVSELAEKLNSVANVDNETSEKLNRVSKAQRKKEKKEQMQKEIDERIKSESLLYKDNKRTIELSKIKEILNEMALKLYDIESDGDCLYKALCHQLSLNNKEMTVEMLRQNTANYMLSNKDKFIHFLASSKNEDDLMDEMEYSEYCDAISKTKTWGGQPELTAISNILQLPVKVIQANGPIICIGEQFTKCTDITLTLSYHRHAFQLGEHYNSVVKK